MASKKWIAVCQCCGKAGTKRSSSSRPSDAPPGIFGTCKSSPDGKHKPIKEYKGDEVIRPFICKKMFL